MFTSWYTDTVDVYRVVQTVKDNITTEERELIASGVACRVYSTTNTGPAFKDTAARLIKSDKLACSIDTDIRTGDELLVIRGGNLGAENEPVRYFAGSVQQFYDPVGGALTGLQHLEVGLLDENIVR